MTINKVGMPPEMYAGVVRMLRRWAPKYDEITTFLAAESTILVLVFHPELRDAYQMAWSSWHEKCVVLALVGWTGFAIFGMAACLASVLSRKENSPGSKTLMGMFTMGAYGVAGIVATVECMPMEAGLSWIFPILNILAGLLLLYQMVLVPEDSVTDRQATPVETVFAGVCLIGLSVLCRWWVRAEWGMTYSICLTYSCFAGAVARWVSKSRGCDS